MQKKSLLLWDKKARGEVVKNLVDYQGKTIVIDSSVLNNYGGQNIL